MGSVFLAQGVVVCNRCDSGVAGFAVQPAAANQLVRVFHRCLRSSESKYFFRIIVPFPGVRICFEGKNLPVPMILVKTGSLKGKGVQVMGKAGAYGDLYVTVQVQVPRNLSEESKRKLREFDTSTRMAGTRGSRTA